MKRILGASFALLLAFTAMGTSVAGAEDPDDYESLIQYFHGDIDKATLESRLEETNTPIAPGEQPPRAFSRTHRELGDDYTQSITCGGKPHPVHEAFRRDPLGTDWSYADSIFCNETTGEWVTGRRYQAGVDYAHEHQLIPPGAPGYNPVCLYRNSAGDIAPTYRWDPETETYTVIHGARWDPIAEKCSGWPTTPERPTE